MKLCWDNLKFYIIGLFVINFFFLYLAHDKKTKAFPQYPQSDNDSDLLLENQLTNLLSSSSDNIPRVNANDELTKKQTSTSESISTIVTTNHTDLPDPATGNHQDNMTSNNNNSIVADVGESIGQGSNPIPFPESGKLEMKLELIENDTTAAKGETNVPSVRFSHLMAVMLILIVMLAMSLIVVFIVIKREKRRVFIEGIDIENMDKYYLFKEY